MRRTVELAELSNYGARTRQPGEHVWNAIAAELGFGTAQRTNGSTHQPRPGAGTGHDVALDVGRDIDLRGDRSIDLVTPPLDGVTPDPPDQDHAEASATTRQATLRAVPGARSPTPRPTDPVPAARRWPRWAAPVAALFIGAALGAGVLIAAQNRADSVTVEATAPLTPVPGGPLRGQAGQWGTAELVVTNQGQQVRVTASDLPSMPGTSYQVWLFGNDGRMVSLGSLDQGQGQFTVPDDISTQEYRTVDISDEPPDGNPAHSGISMVRGSFS